MREAWIAVDELALANEATLQAADTLLEPKPRESLEFARKRWFILAYLNPITTAWQGAHDGIFGSRKDDHLAGIRTQLEALLKDEDAYWVTQNHGHEKAFRKLCTEIWLANQTPGSRSKTPTTKAPPK
jgi:hypothetical protein